MENLLLVFLALALVALNGFFVAAEFGMVRLRSTRIRAIAKCHGLSGRILAKVHGQLDAYLSACQFGITLASPGLGWSGEPAFARLLGPVFEALGLTSPALIHGIAFAFAFSLISFLHIVVGELAPKSMAIRYPERVGLLSALPLYTFSIWWSRRWPGRASCWCGCIPRGSTTRFRPRVEPVGAALAATVHDGFRRALPIRALLLSGAIDRLLAPGPGPGPGP